ncbi:MAG: ATPase, partial [Gemmatimonadetes bacterium]|nr:ATPase [Gemmatimonadota bacterium]
MSESIVKEITAVGPKPIVLDGTVVNHWFWKFVPVDPLVFSGPVHDGSIVQIARQVYHRMLGRMVAENAHGIQFGVLAAAWLVTIFMGEKLAFRGGGRFGILLGFAAFGAFLFFAVPILMRLACPSSASDEAQSIVKRAFLRELPPDTPADLRDELQNGWLTIDGRPLSSEISAEDGRTTEAARRSVWWIVTAFAVGWAVSYLFTTAAPTAAAPGPDGFDPSQGGFGGGVPGMGSPFGFLSGALGVTKYGGSWMVLLILVIKLLRDKRPLMTRAMELAAAEGVEGSAFVAAGGQPWGAIPETALRRQILEESRVKSPTVELGETTGVFAGRGDVFAPSAGLPFRLSLRDLQMHALVLGGTGSGKTSGVLRPLARQLSEQKNVGLVIMDGKGALPSELVDLPGMQLVDPARGVEISLVSGVEPSVIIDT